jgi:hypothetical protein
MLLTYFTLQQFRNIWTKDSSAVCYIIIFIFWSNTIAEPLLSCRKTPFGEHRHVINFVSDSLHKVDSNYCDVSEISSTKFLNTSVYSYIKILINRNSVNASTVFCIERVGCVLFCSLIFYATKNAIELSRWRKNIGWGIWEEDVENSWSQEGGINRRREPVPLLGASLRATVFIK